MDHAYRRKEWDETSTAASELSEAIKKFDLASLAVIEPEWPTKLTDAGKQWARLAKSLKLNDFREVRAALDAIDEYETWESRNIYGWFRVSESAQRDDGD